MLLNTHRFGGALTVSMLAISVFMVSACDSPVTSKNSPSSTISREGNDKIISDRPQKLGTVMLLLKLKNPPLLSTYKRSESGEPSVDQDLKEAILAEQAEALQKLLALSPDIKVIYTYRMVLNGFSITTPYSLMDDLDGTGLFAMVKESHNFALPLVQENANPSSGTDAQLSEINSVAYIEAQKVHTELTIPQEDGSEIPVRGAGVRVGIIDTGIDYTHSMLGGVGTREAYEAIDPSQSPGDQFPNNKVVGGVDLVGTNYSPGSPFEEDRIPQPDNNPIDEVGHGTHVAGTVAGVGNGTTSYNGVAPDASLYAIKVFGKNSTTDAVVVAALEYAADPNQDLDPIDQLHVVNLSLGGGYGKPHILYSEAIKTLVEGGTVVVASAGNSGNKDNIVGAPSTSEEAISVAAASDNMLHNWTFSASLFTTPNHNNLLVESIEAAITEPIADGQVVGSLVYIGTAHKELSEEVKDSLKGKVAFIDRGLVSFDDKIGRAYDAGAVGVVVANNQDGESLVMGGNRSFDIPGIMISLAIAETIKEEMKLGEVVIQFKTDESIEKPELIGKLTSFSSKGPRSLDSLIKPEITGPGQAIISAARGTGDQAVKMSGTSMSGPHVAGAMALLRQFRPNLTPLELKSLIVNTSTPLRDKGGQLYPISRQGTGLAQVYQSILQPLVTDTPTLSLGELSIESKKRIKKFIELKNTSEHPLNLQVGSQLHPLLRLATNSQNTFTLPAHSRTTLELDLVVTAPQGDASYVELDGYINIDSDAGTLMRIPLLAVVNRTSRISASQLKIFSSSPAVASGAAVELNIENKGNHRGLALIFNSLGKDLRKEKAFGVNSHRSRSCDLQTAGYRMITKPDANTGEPIKALQVAVKLFNPVTQWEHCEISIQIDSNGDQVAEQELVGIPINHIQGFDGDTQASILLNATAMRGIRKTYETEVAQANGDISLINPINYGPAILSAGPMMIFNHSTVAVVEVNSALLKTDSKGNLSLKVGTLHSGGDAIEADDFLEGSAKGWVTINPQEQSYAKMPEGILLEPQEKAVIPMTKGMGMEDMLVLFPTNSATLSNVFEGYQAQNPKAEFVF